ncbi:MAG: tRNA (N(6)-L-threonylcarbamoyladenosine(37)-C(2))-methylthiotransferase MtaB [Thermotogota bacterium]|nr:tRNA (N(6)-L-threonylcarbamoyladenosine(37)-C(2))-methylthiotransferase MtaB [Thermotogota bacterium]
MKNKKICSFITLGCKVNQYETDFMTQTLLNEGYRVQPISPDTDFVIINTCTVTNEADRKSRQQIRKAKKIAPNSTTIAMGCSVQVMDQDREKIADYRFGNGEKSDIINIIKGIEVGETSSTFDKAYWLRHDQLTSSLMNSGSKTRQNIMIQEGCTNTCTYCKIYHARGTVSVSKRPELIISEINEIGQKNCKEFILAGINLGDYTWEGQNLAALLKKIDDEVHSDYRIRLSSLNPEDVTGELCEQLKLKRFCPHLHLSIQSGSNRVLKRMNREYQADTVIHAVEKLRAIDPLYSISCDIIVGFPGETQQDFQETVQLIKQIRPLKTHIFRYSKKKGTPAARFQQQIDGKIKKERSTQLDNIAKSLSYNVRKAHMGKNREIIVEQVGNNQISGHDEYYLKHNILLLENSYTEGDKVQARIIQIPENSEPDEVNSKIVCLHE